MLNGRGIGHLLRSPRVGMRADRQARCLSSYNGTARLRLSRPAGALAFAAIIAALGCAGCSYQLESLSLSKPDAADPDVTGSISPTAAQRADHAAATAAEVSEADLVYARAAASDALRSGGKGNSVPWQNPQTGVGGNITPLASFHSEG